MNFNEINFNKKNRRPVTDTMYQIDAAEWNALGAEVSRIAESGGGSAPFETLTDAEVRNIFPNEYIPD